MAPKTLPDGRTAVLLSAHSADLIPADAEAILAYLDRPDLGRASDVAAIAATLLRTRRLRRHRTVVRAADPAELADALHAVATGSDHPLVARSGAAAAAPTAFVFPGQGGQWPGMGADAYQRLPVYREAADRCAAAFTAQGDPSPLRYLCHGGEPETFSQIEIQGAQFVHSVALAEVWRSYRISPALTVGHSLGEVGAAWAAGAITLAEAAAAVAARADAVQGLSGRYAMAVLGASVADARRLIDATDGWLELSAVNSPNSVVVSGDCDAVSALITGVEAAGRFGRQIAVSYPGHTSALEPLRARLLSRLPATVFGEPAVPFIGSATGAAVPAGTEFAQYWADNLCHPVRFDHAAVSAIDHGARAFIEMSGHPALLYALGDIAEERLGEEPAMLLGSGHRDEPPTEVLSAGIAAAAVADPGYRWADLLDATAPALPGFPNAPMKRTAMWAVSEPVAVRPHPATPKPTVAVEQWQPLPLPALAVPADQPRIAVLDLAAERESTALSEALRHAVTRYPGVSPGSGVDADVLIVVAPPLDHPDPARAADELAGRIDTGLLDYVDAIGPQCRAVWLITVGGEQVLGAEPVALPAPAALAAMHRCLGFEHPDQTFCQLDLASAELTAATAATVIDIVLTGNGENALRCTDDTPVRYRRVVHELGAAPVGAPWPLGSGLFDDVVITGGSGAIGLHYARYLAGRGARRIVLLSRGGPDPAVLAELTGRYDTDIVDVRCDITDRTAVADAAAQHAGAGASLLIHAAGAAVFAPRDGLDRAGFAANSAAKLTGLTHLVEQWPLRSDARVLLCSSVTGVWGGKAVIGYAAANRMLDVMAGQLRADGVRSVAVRWGLWAGSSIVDADETARVQRSGLRPMPPVPAIEASLYDHPVDPLVLAADPDRLQLFFGAQQSGPGGADVSDGPVSVPHAVRTELAAVLNTDGAALDLDASLFDLGVDSLLALDLRKRLKRVTGRSVALAKLLGGITAADLIADLCGDASAAPEEVPKKPKKVEVSRD
ncbi:mycobactin polyketide synthase MbtD [Mycolicibacterium thermoresistibile]